DQAEAAFPAAAERRCLGLLGDFAAQPAPVRAAMARLAGRWPEAEGRLAAWLGDPDEDVQVAVAEALAGLGRVLPDLSGLLGSPARRIRRRAVCLLTAEAAPERWRQVARDP